MAANITNWLFELFWLGMYIAVPGAVLYLANEAWYTTFGRQTRRVELATGLIGVPIHELSHAIIAKVFGMPVVEMALYKPDPQSNTLGYVNYSYRKRSIWHGVGRFFVGIAPLIGGGSVVYGLIWLAGLPLLHDYLVSHNLGTVAAFFAWGRDFIFAIDRPVEVAAVLVCVMISTHATPSRADMKGSLAGLFGVVVVYLLYKLFVTTLPAVASLYVHPYVSLPSLAIDLAALIGQMALLGVAASLLFSAASFAVLLWKQRNQKKTNPDALNKTQPLSPKPPTTRS